MATTAEIFEARLKLHDPAGPIRFSEVANKAAIPSPTIHQTGYLTTDTGLYYLWSDTTNPATLLIGDTVLSDRIDTHGVDEAVCRSIYDAMAALRQEMIIEKDDTGGESIEYASLKDQMAYLSALKKECKALVKEDTGNNTAMWGQTVQPEIAGGNL